MLGGNAAKSDNDIFTAHIMVTTLIFVLLTGMIRKDRHRCNSYVDSFERITEGSTGDNLWAEFISLFLNGRVFNVFYRRESDHGTIY